MVHYGFEGSPRGVRAMVAVSMAHGGFGQSFAVPCSGYMLGSLIIFVP